MYLVEINCDRSTKISVSTPVDHNKKNRLFFQIMFWLFDVTLFWLIKIVLHSPNWRGRNEA